MLVAIGLGRAMEPRNLLPEFDRHVSSIDPAAGGVGGSSAARWLQGDTGGTLQGDIGGTGTQPLGVIHEEPEWMMIVTLRKAEGCDLGINVSNEMGNDVLLVRAVKPNGAVAAWNRQLCSASGAVPLYWQVIRAGDRIVGVNGVSNDDRTMVREIYDSTTVRLAITRNDPQPHTTLRSEATPFSPQARTHEFQMQSAPMRAQAAPFHPQAGSHQLIQFK